MPREELSILVPDLAGFVRALERAVKVHGAESAAWPTHTQWLNIVARALGHRNHQALRAAARRQPARAAPAPGDPLPTNGNTAPPPDVAGVPAPPAAAAPQVTPLVHGPAAVPALSANARKALAQFDDQGRLMRWPVKFSVQRLAMWVLWSRFDAKRPYSEREVNAILRDANGFGDHVTLRRELVNHRLLTRKSDCSEYRKLPARPDDEARQLLTQARARFRGAQARPRGRASSAGNPEQTSGARRSGNIDAPKTQEETGT